MDLAFTKRKSTDSAREYAVSYTHLDVYKRQEASLGVVRNTYR